MRRAHLFVIAFGFVCASAAYLEAQVTIVQDAGPISGAVDVQHAGQVLATSWTQNSAFSGVSVFATTGVTLEIGPPEPGLAFLTTQIGPGTTTANQVASAPFTFPAQSSEVILFTGLTLAPGTYYLTLADNGNSFGDWFETNNPTLTTAAGVTLNPDLLAFPVDATYPPASNFLLGGTNLLFGVTGTAVPEPSTLATLLIGAGIIGVLSKRRS